MNRWQKRAGANTSLPNHVREGGRVGKGRGLRVWVRKIRNPLWHITRIPSRALVVHVIHTVKSTENHTMGKDTWRAAAARRCRTPFEVASFWCLRAKNACSGCVLWASKNGRSQDLGVFFQGVLMLLYVGAPCLVFGDQKKDKMKREKEKETHYSPLAPRAREAQHTSINN